MTRLRMRERAVLDTLIDAGVARSRSEALAWCVRLVDRHQGEWIGSAARRPRPRCRRPGRPGPTSTPERRRGPDCGRDRRLRRLPRTGSGRAARSRWRTPSRPRHEPGAFVWIGLHEPSSEEFEAVAKEFELHPLVVEDAVNAHQRPKVEVYDHVVLVVLKTARYDAAHRGDRRGRAAADRR